MSTGVKILATQAVCLVLGSLLFEVWHPAYTLAYLASFLLPMFFLLDDGEQVGMNPLLLIGGFFSIWLLTFPLIHCAIFIAGASCEGHKNFADCSSLAACSVDVIHHHYGEQISKMSLWEFFSESDDILEGLLNIVPYAMAKGVLFVIGVNWLSVVLNILIVFVVHTGAAVVSLSLMRD